MIRSCSVEWALDGMWCHREVLFHTALRVNAARPKHVTLLTNAITVKLGCICRHPFEIKRHITSPQHFHDIGTSTKMLHILKTSLGRFHRSHQSHLVSSFRRHPQVQNQVRYISASSDILAIRNNLQRQCQQK